MVEWSITVVLKTTVLRGTGGSNPSLSAKKRTSSFSLGVFSFFATKRASHHRSGVLASLRFASGLRPSANPSLSAKSSTRNRWTLFFIFRVEDVSKVF